MTYAIPDVGTPDCGLEFTAQSDGLDGLVGDFEAYSQAALTDEDADESERPFEDRTDQRAIVLAAVFVLVDTVLVVETVFVVFVGQFQSDNLLGSLISAVLGIALFANFLAGIAAAWSSEVDPRWQPRFATPLGGYL